MKIEQSKYTEKTGWVGIGQSKVAKPHLVAAFGSTALIKDPGVFNQLKSRYPQAHILSCSTAGEITKDEVSDNSLVVTAIELATSTIQVAQVEISAADDSFKAGLTLAKNLPSAGLVHVMVFSDGLKVNGTALVKGLVDNLPEQVSATGGLVGDGSDFKHTYVGLDKVPEEGKIVAVGFYGAALKVGYGSLGGWDAFGPERTITKSKNNVLLELDNQPALLLYKQYLGEKAKDLPASGLLFPLSLRTVTDKGESGPELVRTLLAVDEKDQSMTFAGDMPEGALAKLMKANFDRLVDGASGAASMSIEALGSHKPELAILISCIGRKLVLKERVEEEIEAVRSVVGPQAAICGFYSYGELCPVAAAEKQCQLHNQTMTITTFREE